MKQEKIDRRVKYTKNLLKEALIELLQEKHISNISVKELCEKADINRSTFYSHYADPYDLLHQIEKEVLSNVMQYLDDQIHEEQNPQFPTLQFTTILEYAKKNAVLFDVLLGENSNYVFQKDIMELSQLVSSQYNRPMDATVRKYLEAFVTTGMISVFKLWIQDGTKESPEYISNLLLMAIPFKATHLNDD